MQAQCHYASHSLTNLAEFLDYQCCDKEAHEHRKDRPRKASHEEQVTNADSVTVRKHSDEQYEKKVWKITIIEITWTTQTWIQIGCMPFAMSCVLVPCAQLKVGPQLQVAFAKKKFIGGPL